MSNQSNIPFVDSASLASNYRFHVDGNTQNLQDALRYLDVIVEFADNFPETKTEYNDLMSWIRAFKYSYERIPAQQKV